jgi:hypothetical protein
MVLCLNFPHATTRRSTQTTGFYLNTVHCKIVELVEVERMIECTIMCIGGVKIRLDTEKGYQGKQVLFVLRFTQEVEIYIDNFLVKLWLGNNTNLQTNMVHICFDASKEVRIVTEDTLQKNRREISY